MERVMSCGVLVVRGEPIQSILLMKHADRLDLPKGHVDPGETELECALRELHEETGITADDIEFDTRFRYTTSYTIRSRRHGGDWVEKTLVVFLARLHRDVAVIPTEHEGFEWCDWRPPHRLQERTIDPLLEAVEKFFSDK